MSICGRGGRAHRRDGVKGRCWRALVLAVFATLAHAQAPLAPETIFRRAEWDDVQLSPDGTKLTALVPVAGRRNLSVVDLATMAATGLTAATDTDVASYTWIDVGRLVVEFADIADASGRIVLRGRVALNIDGSESRRLDGLRGFAVVHRFMDGSGSVVISAFERSRNSADAYLLDSRTGKKRLLTYENPGGVIQWIADHRGQVRAAVARDRATGQLRFMFRATADAPWQELARTREGDRSVLVPLAFDFDDRTLFVSATAGGDRRAIYRYDPQSATLAGKVYDSADYDAGGLVLDFRGRRLAGVRTGDAPGGTAWLDERWQQQQQQVDRALPATRNQLSWGRDNTRRVLVTARSDVQPAKFWLLDTATGRLEEQASSRKWIDPGAMSPMRTIRYRARDGLDIPAQLVVPKQSDGRNLPLVVMIHGGPHVPGYGWGFNPEAQYFASFGYAVLLPDFRGTTGYGRAFVEAGYRQWGQAMQDDVTDGVRWAVQQGIADQARVCLYGGSYGGYAALMGLVREPAMFRCAVAFVAVTDIALLFDAGWSAMARQDDVEAELTRVVGDPAADRARFEANSPQRQVAKISAPVLLAFGGEDRRVPLVHGVRMRDALRAAGKPVEWVMYPDEAHGFNKDENRFDFYRRVGAFLQRNLEAVR